MRLEAAFDNSGGSFRHYVRSLQRYARRLGSYGGSCVHLAGPLERSGSPFERFIYRLHAHGGSFERHERSVGGYVQNLSR